MDNINVKKKNNNAGFTLVELIVVMALMGIIFGAILNFIEPTSELYATTNAYLNQEEAVTSINTVLSDDLMYATDVCVFTGTADVDWTDSQVNLAAYLVNYAAVQTGGQAVTYNNCIVLDNKSVRDDTSSASAKGATGSIRKYALTAYNPTTAVNTDRYVYTDVTTDASLTSGDKLFTNYFALEDLGFMDDYKFFFTVEGPTSSQEQVLKIKTDVYSPTYNSSSADYEFVEKNFSSENTIEFVNINSGAATSNCDLDSSDSNTSYILIFYNRRAKIPEETINLTFKCHTLKPNAEEGYQEICSFTAPSGSNITQTIIDMSESLNTIEPTSDTHVYYSTGMYSTIPNDPFIEGKTYYDLINTPGSGGIINLYAVYKQEAKSAVTYTVNIYNDSQKTTLDQWINVPYGGSVSLTASVPSGYDGAYYAYCGTTLEADLSNIKNDTDIYLYYFNKYNVKFVLENGTSYKGGAFDMAGVPEGTLIVEPVGFLEPVIDLENSKQYSYELLASDVFTTPITGNTTYIIKETVIEIVQPESGLIGVDNGGWDPKIHPILLKNETDAEITEAVITIKFDTNVSSLSFTGCPEAYKLISHSGDTIEIKFKKVSAGWWVTLSPHSSTESLVINLSNNASITEIKCEVIS